MIWINEDHRRVASCCLLKSVILNMLTCRTAHWWLINIVCIHVKLWITDSEKSCSTATRSVDNTVCSAFTRNLVLGCLPFGTYCFHSRECLNEEASIFIVAQMSSMHPILEVYWVSDSTVSLEVLYYYRPILLKDLLDFIKAFCIQIYLR